MASSGVSPRRIMENETENECDDTPIQSRFTTRSHNKDRPLVQPTQSRSAIERNSKGEERSLSSLDKKKGRRCDRQEPTKGFHKMKVLRRRLSRNRHHALQSQSNPHPPPSTPPTRFKQSGQEHRPMNGTLKIKNMVSLQTMVVHVRFNDPIKYIKREIEANWGVLSASQLLMYDGEQLADSSTLTDAGVPDKSVLSLCLIA